MYRIIVFIISFLLHLNVKGQDPIFTQYYHSPLYANPGLTGTAENNLRVCANMRMQWHHAPSIMRYGVLSVDGFNKDYQVGGGFMMSHFNEGYLRTTNVSLLASRQFGTDDEQRVFASIGFQAGFTFRGLNNSQLLFADEIDVMGPIPGSRSEAELLRYNNGQPFFDASSGFVISWKNWMFGGAWHHMTQPYNGLTGLGQFARLPSRFSGSVSKMCYLDVNDLNNSWVVKPTVIYNRQFNSQTLVVGALVETPANRISFGTWYRNNAGFFNNHSVLFGINITLGSRQNYLNGPSGQKTRTGITYDLDIANPSPRYTVGSSELGFIFEKNIGGDGICPKPYKGEDLKKYPWAFH